MITRSYLDPISAVRYSWKNLLYSMACAAAVFALYHHPALPHVEVPISVVAILGTALAIILGFRNTSAYERWWEARKIWGGVVNESRTFTRQALTLADPLQADAALKDRTAQLVRNQLAWVNALRLQMRGVHETKAWDEQVAPHLDPLAYKAITAKRNRVTHLGMLQGRALRQMRAEGIMDSYRHVQIDNTLTRLTDLQGMCERIKHTPLPRPYDYYTMAFLHLFILSMPLGLMEHFIQMGITWMIFPVTVIVGWIFYQIYIFGKVMSSPFENWATDVPLDAISTVIAIDLKEILGDADVPLPLKPHKGRLM